MITFTEASALYSVVCGDNVLETGLFQFLCPQHQSRPRASLCGARAPVFVHVLVFVARMSINIAKSAYYT